MTVQVPGNHRRVGRAPGSWVRHGARAVVMLVAVAATIVHGPVAFAVETARPAQWYLDAWKIEEAWQISQGEGVTIAVIDTGVNETHPDLVGQISASPLGSGDSDGHGTSMAGSIVGTGRGADGQGVFGVAPKAKVISYKAADTGNVIEYDKVVPAIRSAADSPAKIINLSIGGGANSAQEEAVKYALSRGKLVVNAAGNREKFNPPVSYPASIPGVLGVGGHDRNGTVWSRSLTGRWVSIAAPSVDIVSACSRPTGYCKAEGTSSAAALTSGIAALVWAQHPDYTANQVIRVLIESANKPQGPVPNDLLGWGNVSPRNALNWTGDPGPPDVNPLIGVRGDMPSSSSISSAPLSPSPIPSGSTHPPTAPPSPEAVAVSADDDDESGGGLLFIVGIVAAGAAVLGLGVFLLVRSRRNRPASQWSS